MNALNDFLHLLYIHPSDDQFQYIFDSLGGFCNAMQCDMFQMRNIMQISNNDFNTVQRQIFSKIHCHYRHCYDIGFRLSATDRQILIADEKHEDEKHDDTKHNVLVNKKLLKFNQILLNKRKQYNNISINRRNKKYNQFVMVDEKTQNNDNTQPQKMYNYGKEFWYKE
eukprot:300044_1